MILELRSRLREILVAGLLVTIAVVLFLFQPLPEPSELQHCGTPTHVWGPLNVFVNCDSGEFLLLAKHPSLLLTPAHRTRQNRPLYAALGWTLAWPLRVLDVESIGRRVLGAEPVGRTGRLYGDYLPEYGAFLLLNWVLLVASVVLFTRLLDAESPVAIRALLPLAVLLVNEVTKAFFWTPHFQIFNVFIPVASIALFRWQLSPARIVTWRDAAAIGLLLGVGNLAYGAFALTAGGAALCLVIGERKLSKAILLLALFFLPLAVWIAFVTARTGAFYSEEIARFRQFVWLADAAFRGIGPFGTAVSENLSTYLTMLGAVVIGPALMLGVAVAAARIAGGRSRPTDRERAPARAIAVYVLVDVLFFAFMGFYRTRLAWTIVPALLLILGREIGRLERAVPARAGLAMKMGVAGVALGYTAYWIARAGPYF
jgi:hypothetical protein